MSLPFDKSLLILAGFLALFIICYAVGWFCDKNFRLVMRKQKLYGLKKVLFHFRGSKAKEDRGHALVCVKLETFSLVNLVMGGICFAAVKVTDNTYVFLGSAALMAIGGLMLIYQLYMNIMKYLDRKKQIEKMDETGFEDYRAAVKTPSEQNEETQKAAAYPTVRVPERVDSAGRTDSMESGR